MCDRLLGTGKWVHEAVGEIHKCLSWAKSICATLSCSIVPNSVTLQTVAQQGSSVHGIFQTRMLEWVTIFSFRESSQPRDQTPVSCIGRQIIYH